MWRHSELGRGAIGFLWNICGEKYFICIENLYWHNLIDITRIWEREGGRIWLVYMRKYSFPALSGKGV